MWTNAGTGKWTRDGGYLLNTGDLIVELHGETVHIYRPDPNADPAAATGGPLNGYVCQSSEPAIQAPPDAAAAWRLLSARAAQPAAPTAPPVTP